MSLARDFRRKLVTVADQLGGIRTGAMMFRPSTFREREKGEGGWVSSLISRIVGGRIIGTIANAETEHTLDYPVVDRDKKDYNSGLIGDSRAIPFPSSPRY